MEGNDYKQFDRRKSDVLFAEIHDEFAKIHAANAAINATMTSLVVAIKGDEFGNEGIVTRHNKLEERFEHYKKNQSNIDTYQDKKNSEAINSLDKRVTTLETTVSSWDREEGTNWSRLQIISSWAAIVAAVIMGILTYLK